MTDQINKSEIKSTRLDQLKRIIKKQQEQIKAMMEERYTEEDPETESDHFDRVMNNPEAWR